MKSKGRLGLLARSPKKATLGFGLGVMLLGFWALMQEGALTERLTHIAQDAFQRAAPRPSSESPAVAVVDIDEASLAALGQWPWPRDVIGDLVDRLGEMGAASIAFDMAFAEADRTSLRALSQRLAQKGLALDVPQDAALADNDLAFAQAIARNPVVLGVALADETGKPLPLPKAGISHSGSDPRLYLPAFADGLSNLAVLTEAAGGMGSFSFLPSRDNIIREMPLFARSGEALYPALSLEALRVAQGAANFVLKSSDGSAGQSGRAGLEAVKVGHFELPANPDGGFPIHFSGMKHMPILPAAEILTDPEVHRAEVEGRIILIGSSAIGLRDLVATPLAASVAGVIVHAEMIDQIIMQDFLSRPDWLRGAELSAALGLSLLFLALLLWGGAAIGTGALAAMVLATYGASFLLFRNSGLLIDPVAPIALPLIVFLATVPLLYGLGNRERAFVRSAFGRYLSPTLVARLSKDPAALQLGGEIREVTILFSDIRGFTALSETLPPRELTDLLNRLLTPLTATLLDHEATIDKYIGDAIMAMWNAPLDIEAHPRRACSAALAMAKVMAERNNVENKPLEIGIGLHLGEACVGNLGSDQRFSYSAIGDTVNLAARVEGMTKQYGVQILITEALYKAAPDFAAIEADLLRVVGRQEPIRLYALLGDAVLAQEPNFKEFSQKHAEFLALWQRGDFAAAEAALAQVRQIAPSQLDKFYEVYAARVNDVLADPPQDWTGIFQATSK